MNASTRKSPVNQQEHQEYPDRRTQVRRREDRALEQEQEPKGMKLARVIDFRVPLHWLLSSAACLLWVLIGMYFALGSVTRELAEIKLALKVNDVASVTAAGDLALLKYRLAAIESELSGLKAAQQQRAQQQERR